MIKETGTEEKLIIAVHEAYEKKLIQYAKEHKVAVEQLSEKDKEDCKDALYPYTWDYLTKLDGLELKKYYNALLMALGSAPLQEISRIYVKAVSSIEESY